jgi:predicted histidine transporter YuiF (NhaC family)
MQPITIEPVSILASIVVIVTLIYSYVKNRAADKKEVTVTEKQREIIIEEKDDKLPVITALIAAMMEQKQFKIKNLVIGKEEEISMWRQSGRQEIMRRRATMQR